VRGSSPRAARCPVGSGFGDDFEFTDAELDDLLDELA
jgi:hypothetical protein